MFRKIISILLIITAVISACAIPTYAKTDTVSAQEYVDGMTAGWNLGNTLDCTGDWIKLYTDASNDEYEKAWGNPVTTKAMITAVKNKGFNAVRVPVTWSDHIDNNGNVDKAWMDRVQEVVDYVISQDMYCILNVHHDGGSDGWIVADKSSLSDISAKYTKLWIQIAMRFKDYDSKLSFEGFNEVLDKNDNWTKTDPDSYRALNELNQFFVTVVRKTGGNNSERNLFVQTYASNSEESSLKNFTLPYDTAKDHIIVQVHCYDPQAFCSATATWTELTDKWGSSSDKAQIDSIMKRISSYSSKLKVPFIIGEFGCETKDNDSERGKYAEYFVSAASKENIKCFWWDASTMQLLDRANLKWVHPEIPDGIIKAVSDNKSIQIVNKNVSTTETAPVLSLKKTSTGIKLYWTSCENAYCYRVYEYNFTTKKYEKIASIKGTSKTLIKLSSGKHRYKVIPVYINEGKLKSGKSSNTLDTRI